MRNIVALPLFIVLIGVGVYLTYTGAGSLNLFAIWSACFLMGAARIAYFYAWSSAKTIHVNLLFGILRMVNLGNEERAGKWLKFSQNVEIITALLVLCAVMPSEGIWLVFQCITIIIAAIISWRTTIK